MPGTTLARCGGMLLAADSAANPSRGVRESPASPTPLCFKNFRRLDVGMQGTPNQVRRVDSVREFPGAACLRRQCINRECCQFVLHYAVHPPFPAGASCKLGDQIAQRVNSSLSGLPLQTPPRIQSFLWVSNGCMLPAFVTPSPRSEERRVGKECRSRWSRYG